MSLIVERLGTIVSAIDSFSKTDFISSEANTKKKIIEPLLEFLGWDTRGSEVILEYPVRIGSTTKHVDCALMLENKPVVLAEAKPYDATLSDDDSAQIISYGRIEDVQWVVLTDGQELKVFNTSVGKTEKECLVIEVNLKKAPEQAQYLNLVSRESILTGEIEATAKRLAAARSALLNLRQKEGELSQKYKEILLNMTGTNIEKRVENISKQLAKQTIQMFEKQTEMVPERVPESEIQLITRNSLLAKPSGEVVLCPSKAEGVEFLKKYNAWGFVTMSKHVPYFALYVGKPFSSVLYFGEIESITQPLESREDLARIQEKDTATFQTGKRVIHLKPGTLVQFKDPVPLKNRRTAPRGLRYTKLEKLTRAMYTEEL